MTAQTQVTVHSFPKAKNSKSNSKTSLEIVKWENGKKQKHLNKQKGKN